MRTLVCGTLLIIMPFGGMRVTCVDAPPGASGSIASAETLSDCERLCPLHKPSADPSVPSADPSVTAGTPSGTDTGSGCALSTDGASLSILGSVAILRPEEPLRVPVTVSAVPADGPRFYLDPTLTHLGPPPKPQAL